MRKERNLTLAQVSELTGIASSQLSQLENGKREAKVSVLQNLARAYGVTIDDFLQEVPNRRTLLEIELDRAMRSPLAQQKGLPSVRISPRMPMEVLETLVALHRELARTAEEQVATPEEARRANTELRAEMKARNNYFGDLEQEAARLLKQSGYRRGPLSQHEIGAITAHLGFTLHHVGDLPHSTRSVTDLKQMRIYLPRATGGEHDPRSVLLQALGHHVLGHQTPNSYGEFLRQRIETNYFAAALLMPESTTVEFLRQAKKEKQLAVEDLRDAYAVSYEAASHRITNLITHHLEIPVHFQKVHDSGIIYKAYENDGVSFPADHTGAIEGQPVCRYWTSRQVFDAEDKFNAFDQYTDTPAGTFWCTARVEKDFSTCIGVPYVHAKWFRGRVTRERSKSGCPDESCCRRPPSELAREWAGNAWPSARAHSHLLAALPPGAFPGVDETEVYTFLQQHS
ncbi:XRE family transcriptional regulator [Enemella dayhoffiae]|uniref:XRE family transcriptional regulator n=2 Tax=Enemella dayhoffiae TaxID=2016507 RepID=A0A255HEC2_9ACTN|nr:XRE family transcriptional regulator [Enemella dayhoffiae]